MSNFSLIFEAYSVDTQTYLFTPGFRSLFLQFNLFVMIPTGILAVAMNTFVINAWVVHKTRDIAIMKGIGMLPSIGYSIFMAEILLLTLVGYFIGNFVGFAVYLGVFIILDETGFHGQFQIAWPANIMFFAITLMTVLYTGGRKLTKIIEKQTVGESLAGDIPFSTRATSKFNFILSFLCRFGTSVKIAIRNLTRRRYDYRRTFTFLTIAGMILFTSTFAPISLNANVQGYLQGAIDENTILIGHKDLLPYVVRTYSQFSDASQGVDYGDLNFSLPEFYFSQNNISALQSIDGIKTIDGCVCLLVPFKEMLGVKFVDTVFWGNNTSFYIRKNATWVGQNREGTTILFGINSSDSHSTFAQYTFIAPTEMENITIGDGIASGYTDDYTVQKLKIQDKEFWMSNVVIDPCYNGRTVYMGIRSVWDLWKERNNTYNLIFVRCSPNLYEDTLNRLDILAMGMLGSEFGAFGLRDVMRANAIALFSIQTYFILITFILFGIALTTISNYHKGSSSSKIRDLFIMRMLGAKKRFQFRCYYLETLLVLLPSLSLASSLGMIFVESFLTSNIQFLPPLWVPLSIAVGFLGIFAILNIFLSNVFVRRAHGTPGLLFQ